MINDNSDKEPTENSPARATDDKDTETNWVNEISLSRRNTILTGLGLGALGLLGSGSRKVSANVDAGRYLRRDDEVLHFTGAAEWENEVTDVPPNSARGMASVIGGGRSNETRGEDATVGGGQDNRANEDGATVGGGHGNTAIGPGATVGGGGSNAATEVVATVAGGEGNAAEGSSAAIGGGKFNIARGEDTTISGGRSNRATGDGATISGGEDNAASERSTAVGGGRSNEARGEATTVAGGRDNTASGEDATVGGGQDNRANEEGATVDGGRTNIADAAGATVGGGGSNAATEVVATVAGGEGNAAEGPAAAVSGGKFNVARGEAASIGGGRENRATGEGATVPGGRNNSAEGDFSFAAGRAAVANHAGAFVVGNSDADEVESGGVDEVRFQAGGGFVIEQLPTGRGRNLQWDEGTLVRPASSARYKTNIEPLETEPGAVLNLEPRSFEYTEAETTDVGLIAEEVAEHIPELVLNDDEGRPDAVKYDQVGVYLVPELRRQRDRIDELEEENTELRGRLVAIEDHIEMTTVASSDGSTETHD